MVSDWNRDHSGVQCDLYHRKSYGLQNDPGNYPGMAAAGNLSDAVGSAGDLSVSDRADGQKNYDKCFEDIGFKGKNGKFPKYAGSSKEGKKILLFFQSTIPLSEWRSSRERLETALDCSIIKIENGRNKRTVKLTTLPSDYKIPTMVKWSEEYLNDKNGVLTLGISALDTISFNLNRVPHVLVAGETDPESQ